MIVGPLNARVHRADRSLAVDNVETDRKPGPPSRCAGVEWQK